MTRIVRYTVAASIAVATMQTSAQAQSARSAASQEKTADSLFASKAFDRAYVLYDSLARRDTASARYWNQLGYAAASLSRYAAGAAAFARAARINPNPI